MPDHHSEGRGSTCFLVSIRVAMVGVIVGLQRLDEMVAKNRQILVQTMGFTSRARDWIPTRRGVKMSGGAAPHFNYSRDTLMVHGRDFVAEMSRLIMGVMLCRRTL
jgi:hypothetical protein